MIYPFDNDIKGKSAFTKGTSVRVRATPSTKATILTTHAKSVTFAGTLTGTHTMPVGSEIWYEVLTPENKKGWLRNDVMTIGANTTSSNFYQPIINTSTPTSTPTTTTTQTKGKDDDEAQKLLDDIRIQDTETLNNLNQAAAMIPTLKAKGVNTTTHENRLKKLVDSVAQRQDSMTKTTWGKVKDKISGAWTSIKKFFGFSGLGEPITITVIVVVSLIAGAGTTALVMLKPWKNQSTIDLKESKELKDLLDKADPKTAQIIRDDLKNQMVDAYTTGNRQGTIGSYGKILTYAGVALLAIWGIPKLMDVMNKK